MPDPVNLLSRETSPYLRQHADNPVHWRAWNREALEDARQSNRPILLSVGYAACHWCHVMAHESFEDPATSAVMNRLYVNIKVDREERPDIDHIYMTALHALGERGGWPLTMFLSPEGEPFWGGTYFPPEPRYGRPSFRQVLEAVAAAWAGRDPAIRTNSSGLRDALLAGSASIPGTVPGAEEIQGAAERLLGLVDREGGGLQGAPKFPNPPLFRLLWQVGIRHRMAEPRAAVRTLLRRMSQGGIHDHLGGGFARYATDARWLVPHFEKMLYDNAQILDLLALAHAETPEPLFAQTAAGIVGWLERRMHSHDAFAASEDADSEGEEGRFYVWTESEIDACLQPALGAEAAGLFKRCYDVRPDGNWEGRTILQRLTDPADPQTEQLLERARTLLFEVRERRVRPGRDDKLLADWNGLAIAALCRAACAFDRPDWLVLAEAAFAAIHRLLATKDGRVQHAWCDGRVSAPGMLDDQASVGLAALALFEATGDPRLLASAAGSADAARRWFMDGDGSFFLTASDAGDVVAVRPRSAADGVTPSGNAMMAQLQARLFHLTGEDRWRAGAEAVLSAFGGAGAGLAGMPALLAAADLLQAGGAVVIAGGSEAQRRKAASLACAGPDPALCVLAVDNPEALPLSHPAAGKMPQGGALTAWICRGQVCGLPIIGEAALQRALGDALHDPDHARPSHDAGSAGS